MYIKGNVIITDPGYMKNTYGTSNHIERSTIYGDWRCMVYPGVMEENKKPEEWWKHYEEYFKELNFGRCDDDVKERLIKNHSDFKTKWEENIIGEFCADSGMVAVYNMETVSEKDIQWCREHPFAATIINDFEGNVEFVVKDNEVHVVGTGNKPFFTVQSGY